MQRPLDPLSFRKNTYARPNQDWVCGHEAEGRVCPLGPDARGNCRHTGECAPAKKGDRWTCTRSEAQGGKCEQGPLPDGTCAHPIPPCQPVRSLRSSRGMVVRLTVAITAGALLILFGGYFRRGWMDPGALTNAHAPSATKCSDCHSAEPAAAPRLVSNSSSQRALADSALCLKCHQLGDQPLDAHGISAAVLTQKQRPATGPNESTPLLLRAGRALAGRDAHAANLACATCHQEHHGRNFELARLSDAQCQTCHAVQFASFEKGHPEFAGYPYQRRTRLFFDHDSHLNRHFAEKKDQAPAGCQSCHAPGPGGRFMQVKNFNTTCVSCHSSQIKGDGMTVKGVAFFSVPGIDSETLAGMGMSIGEWPKFADSKLTPFMELLLNRDPATRATLAKLEGVDLLDLTKATPEQLAAAEQFAWAVKSLLFHLVVGGQPFLMKEMKDEMAPAGLEVPRAALLAAQMEWMPHLLKEVGDYQKGIKPPMLEKPMPAATKSPAGKQVAESSSKPTASPGDDLLAGGNDDLAAATPSPTPKPSSGDGDDLSEFLEGSATAAPPAATPTPASEMLSAEDWTAAGGWYQPQESFTLFYRPKGHADPFLVAWLDAAARLRSKPASAETRDAFQKLADPQTPGLCLKCHTVEASGGMTVVNWAPAQPNTESHPFTTFSHTTHFSLVGDTGCQTCHALNPKAEYAKFFSRESETAAAHDVAKFQSNFAPVSKMLCVQCHQPRVAGDGCILCHRYHAASRGGGLTDVGRFRGSSDGEFLPGGK